MESAEWIEITLNAIHFLYAIGEEEKLNIKFERKTKPRITPGNRSVKIILIISYSMMFIFFSDDNDILVELTIKPFLMFVGTGLTVLIAQHVSAINALQYIKLSFQNQ